MEGNAAIPGWILPFLFSVSLWIGVLYIISFLSGWQSLARVYPMLHTLSGERFRFESASMRAGMGYGNCLTMEANAQGLRISTLFLFRIGHRSLFIPWEDIAAELDSFLWFKYAKLRFAKCSNIPFSISVKLAEKLSQASGFQFKVDGTG